MTNELPLFEFDPTPESVLEPYRPKTIPEDLTGCVISFFPEMVRKWAKQPDVEKIGSLFSGGEEHSLYLWKNGLENTAFYFSGMGAPQAACLLEQAMVWGFSRFIACGGAGVLQSSLVPGKIIIPSSAVRDEGTSFHYQPASREIGMDPNIIKILTATLREKGVEYLVGKNWTTDACYRETPDKIALRRQEGCLTVEMECSALAAVCHFRGVEFGQYLYAGDDVSGEKWNPRGWTKSSARSEIFQCALRACLCT